MRNLTVFVTALTLISISVSNAMLITDRDESRIFIAESLQNFNRGNFTRAYYFANRSCNEGNSNGCIMKAYVISEELYKAPDYKQSALLLDLTKTALKACELKNPVGCKLFAIELNVTKEKSYKNLEKYSNDLLVMKAYLQYDIDKCKNKPNYRLCVNHTIEAFNTTMQLFSLIKKYSNDIDKYNNLACEYSKTYTIHSAYGLTNEQMKLYNHFAKQMKEKAAHSCD